MSRVCWIAPGFAGGELYYQQPPRNKVWVSPATLAVGGFFAMRLGPDGFTPLPPLGKPLDPGPGLMDYFGGLTKRLTADLGPQGYEIRNMVWDWRLDVRSTAAAWAESIRQTSTPTEPCSIVAHSTGGLLARLVYYTLQQTGQANLIRRIVTLGTPHQGCYAPVRLLSGGDSLTEQVGGIMDAVILGFGASEGAVPVFTPSSRQLIRVFASFPTLYLLFPLLSPQAAIDDPERGKLYDASRWPRDIEVSQKWLDEAKDSFRSFLLNPQTMPPGYILTAVAGQGFSTPFKLVDSSKIGSPAAYESTTEGDGTVPLSSALPATAEQWTTNIKHSSLTVDSWVLDHISDMVLEIRLPPTPIPPPITVPGPAADLVNGPPVAGVVTSPVLNRDGVEAAPFLVSEATGGYVTLPFFGGSSMYRVSLFYQQQDARLAGWTENYYNAATTMSTALSNGLALARAARYLHGYSSICVRIRAQAVPGNDFVVPPREVQDQVYQSLVNSGVTPSELSDYPTNAILMELYGSGGKRTRLWIKGVRDQFITTVDKTVTTGAGGFLQTNLPEYQTALDAYVAALRAFGFQLRNLSTANQKKDIAAITETGMVTSAAHGLGNGDIVRISGFQLNKYPNRIWKVTMDGTTSANTFQLRYFHPPSPWVLPAGNPKFRLQQWTYVSCTRADGLMATKHNVGRPTKLHSGRRTIRR